MYESNYIFSGAKLIGSAVGNNAYTNFFVQPVPPSEDYAQIIQKLEQLKSEVSMNSTYNLSGGEYIGCAIGENAHTNFSAQPVPPSENYAQIVQELERLKREVGMNSAYYCGLEEIQDGAKKRSRGTVLSAVISFINQFSSATLANLAGGYLCRLLLGL